LKRLRILALVAFFVLLAVTVAWASEAAHGEAGAHGPDWKNFAFRIGNFIIFAFIIWKFAGKKIASFFTSRRYNIENELADLDKRKTDAQKKLKDVEKGIANMEQERQTILAEYRAQGEALKASIIAKAEKSAAQIKAQASISATQEAKVAVERLRAEMAESIADAAQKLLQDKLTAEEHENLIDNYLTKVVLN